MSRIGFVVLVTIALLEAGCGYSSRNYMGSGNGALNIVQLSPAGATAGGSAFTLSVTGAGFGSDAVIYFGTDAKSVHYETSTRITAQIDAADIANPGMVQVYVRTADVNSNAVTFAIQ